MAKYASLQMISSYICMYNTTQYIEYHTTEYVQNSMYIFTSSGTKVAASHRLSPVVSSVYSCEQHQAQVARVYEEDRP